MSDSMRGLFFIMKGQYRKGVEPHYIKEDGTPTHIGGYDPNRKDCHEWYMLIDTKTFRCMSASTDYNKVLGAVYRIIKRHKGDLKSYLKAIPSLGDTAKSTKVMNEEVFKHFGDFFREDIEEMEDLAYSELREEKPLNKSKKLLSKVRKNTEMRVETPKKVVLEEQPKRLVKHKVKIGVKKIPMN